MKHGRTKYKFKPKNIILLTTKTLTRFKGWMLTNMKTIISGGSRISPRLRTKPLFGHFYQQLHENEEIWAGGVHPFCPLPRSANDNCFVITNVSHIFE